MTRASVVVPRGWRSIVGLVAGFGSRRGLPPLRVTTTLRQVHGPSLVNALHERPESALADGLVTSPGGPVVAVRTADCVPILLVDPVTRWAAAVHAGWRGQVAGVIAAALAAARAAKARPGDLLAAVGPAIGPCCYEVGEPVAAAFAAMGLRDSVSREHTRLHVDLRAAAVQLLAREGIAAARIQTLGACTRCESDDYHSFRAAGVGAGRQLSWVGWRS